MRTGRQPVMRALAIVTMCGGVVLGAATGSHAVGPTLNESNCAGVVVSGLASPPFEAVVRAAAQDQMVDNFGFAACGEPPRRNP